MKLAGGLLAAVTLAVPGMGSSDAEDFSII